MTPAGLRAWARRERAEARGGNGNGLLGWCRKALSAYTWCRSNKGPQNEWLFKIGKADSGRCQCGEVMTGTHVVEECPELEQWRPRRTVWKEWREALGERAVSKKEAEEEGDPLGASFFRIYEFPFSFSNPPPVVHRPVVPDRYAIKFVAASDIPSFPRASSVVPSLVTPTTNFPAVVPYVAPAVSPIDYSVISSINFVPASASTLIRRLAIGTPYPTLCGIVRGEPTP